MWPELLAGWIRFRARYRGWELPLFAAPLLPAALFGAIGGNQRIVIGSLVGFGLSLLAARRLRRGRHGDAKAASWLMAAGTGVAAFQAARLGVPFSLLMAAGALYGTRLLYTALPEAAPPPPAPAPPPPPGLVEQARARLGGIERVADRRGDARLRIVANTMEQVLDDLDARPDRLPLARQFLTVHIDGLERITQRLEAGAEPPETLPVLLDDLAQTARELRQKLRQEESEALAIQVKVMSDRLREEGY